MSNYKHIIEVTKSLFRDKEAQRLNEEQERLDDIEYEKRSIKLEMLEKEVAEEKIEITKEKEKVLLQRINDNKFPVNSNFIGNEDTVAQRHYYLQRKVASLTKQRDSFREKLLPNSTIILAELAAVVSFIFILSRLAAENITLVEPLVFIEVLQSLYGYSEMTLYQDMVFQDFPIVLSMSYIAAVAFKDTDAFYSQKVKIRMYYVFITSMVGLFISSLLFSL